MILDLSYNHTDDEVLHQVALIPMLTRFSSSCSESITIEGVKKLTQMPRLMFLDVIYCGLDEKTVRELFMPHVEIRT